MAGKVQVSGSVRGNFECTWTIKGFSSLDEQVGACHRSDVFHLEENGSEWHLAIYPGGRKDNEKGSFVTCVLYGVSYEDLSKWKYYISLRTKDGVLLSYCMLDKREDFPQDSLCNCETIGTEKLAPRLVEDVLVVVLEAMYCVSDITGIFSSFRRSGKVSLGHEIDDWRKLWTSKRNADCVIYVGGQDIPAHSRILSTCSEVFAAMFKHETLEKSFHRVDITDFDKDTIKSLMEFIYTGNVLEMSSGIALELLRAGDKYQVNNLKSYCTNYLMSVLDNANACQILASADIHNSERLRRHALEYISENLSEDDFEAQRPIFETEHDLLWSVLKKFIEKRKIWKKDYL